MSKFADRVRETTTTTGTGTLNLAGVFDASYRTFVAGIGTGKPVIYSIRHQDATLGEWEVGLGVVTDATPDTLSRLKVLSSSNAGALVNFSSGTKDVFVPWTAWHADNVHQIPRRVKCATTTAGTLASDYENGDTVDGITLATGDRLLVKNQATASENGIYLVAASGAPSRVVDLYTGDGAAGLLTIVEQGTVNGDTAWLCTANSGSDVVGTDNLAFVPVVTGPASATDNAIARYDGTSGGKLQGTGVTIDDSDKLKAKSSYSDINAASDGATITFNCNLSNVHFVTLGGDRTLALSNVSTGQRFAVRLKQDTTGFRSVAWWSGISWPSNTEPTLSTTPDHWDWFGFICTGSGTYDAFVLGQDYQ